MLAAGALAALFAALFLLLAIVFALALVIPIWAATLIPGTTLAIVASATLAAGVKRLRQRPPMLERTVASLKDTP